MIRRAAPRDVPALTGLAAAAYWPYVSRIGRHAPVGDHYARVIESGHTWVAEVDGWIAGLLVLIPADDHLLLSDVAVHPDNQSTGLGARLLRLAEDQARELGLPEIRLCANEVMTDTVRYCARHGYVETHRAIEDGYRRVYFSKSVPAERH